MAFVIDAGKAPAPARPSSKGAIAAAAVLASFLTLLAGDAATAFGMRPNLARLRSGAARGDIATSAAAAPAAAAGAATASAAGAMVASSSAAAGSAIAGGPQPKWEGSYSFNLSRPDLQQGLVMMGGTGARARRALSKLLSGQPLRMAFLGGSITYGHATSWKDNTHYVGWTFDWIKKAFPHPDHQLVNGGIPGVPSSYFSACSEWHMPENPDIVFLEFNVNDGGEGKGGGLRRAHERLIRKLMNLPSKPVVVELSIMGWYEPNWWSDSDSPFRVQGGDELMVFAEYYHMPLISERAMVWNHLAQTAQDPKDPDSDRLRPMWNPEAPDMDRAHPSLTGHKWVADMVVYWMQEVLRTLHREPLSAVDEEWAKKPLPLPMYKNNWEAQTTHTCIMAKTLEEVVVKKDDAWQMVNEGNENKPKWGYVSTKVGSAITLKVNTMLSKSIKPGDTVSLNFAYLESYEHMGTFELSCAEGCTCAPLKQNTHRPRPKGHPRVSQMWQVMLDVTAAETCHLKVTVLEETTSGEHKIKILGVIMSEVQGMVSLLLGKGNMPVGIQYGFGASGKETAPGTEQYDPADDGPPARRRVS